MGKSELARRSWSKSRCSAVGLDGPGADEETPMIKSPVLVIVVLALVGCATDSAYQKTTAEFTGCSADDIQISDVNTSGSNTWKAICRNNAKIFKCSKDGCTEIK